MAFDLAALVRRAFVVVLLVYLKKAEDKMLLFEKGGASQKDKDNLQKTIDKLNKLLEAQGVSGDISILNKGGDVSYGGNITTNKLVASADRVVESYARSG